MVKKKRLNEYKKKRKVLRKELLYSPTRLKNLRHKNNLRREDVVKETGLSYDTLYNLETGHVFSPELNTLLTLAKLYGVCIGEFIENRHLNLDYIHCAKNEIKLIQTLRNHPEFDLKTIYAILNQENKKAKLIKEIIKDVLKLPIDTLKDYSNLTKNIVNSLQLREGNHNEKSNIDPVSH